MAMHRPFFKEKCINRLYTLGCICSGSNCASLITPNLSMIRGLQSNKTWCNNEPKPTYRIKVWTPNGWKTFSRPDDMVVRFSVEGDIGKLKFQVSVVMLSNN